MDRNHMIVFNNLFLFSLCIIYFLIQLLLILEKYFLVHLISLFECDDRPQYLGHVIIYISKNSLSYKLS